MVEMFPLIRPPASRSRQAARILGAKASAAYEIAVPTMVTSSTGRRPSLSESLPQNASETSWPTAKAENIRLTRKGEAPNALP